MLRAGKTPRGAPWTHPPLAPASHVTLSEYKQQHWYESLNAADVANDNDVVACSARFLAYVHAGGGAAAPILHVVEAAPRRPPLVPSPPPGASTVAVIPLSSTGKNHIPLSASTYQVGCWPPTSAALSLTRRRRQLPVLRGHAGVVADLHFSPVDDCRIATCSGDQTVRVWALPSDGLNADVTDCSIARGTRLALCRVLTTAGGNPSPPALRAVGARATCVRWHPCARDLLAVSTAAGVQLWDATALGAPAVELAREAGPLPAPAGPASGYTSLEWDYDGSRLAVASSDHVVRVMDARARALEAEFRPHAGRRPVRLAWAGRRDWLVTTGCGAMQEREVALWRAEDLRASKSPVRPADGRGMPPLVRPPGASRCNPFPPPPRRLPPETCGARPSGHIPWRRLPAVRRRHRLAFRAGQGQLCGALL